MKHLLRVVDVLTASPIGEIIVVKVVLFLLGTKILIAYINY